MCLNNSSIYLNQLFIILLENQHERSHVLLMFLLRSTPALQINTRCICITSKAIWKCPKIVILTATGTTVTALHEGNLQRIQNTKVIFGHTPKNKSIPLYPNVKHNKSKWQNTIKSADLTISMESYLLAWLIDSSFLCTLIISTLSLFIRCTL